MRSRSRTPTTSERFWSKVTKGKTDIDCWIWVGARNNLRLRSTDTETRKGVGVFSFWGHIQSAPHWAWTEENGPILDGLFVCHHCDNPVCVNPKHLFLGTNSDNMADMVAKGRQSKHPRPSGQEHYLNLHPEKRNQGQDVPNAKLTNDQAREIKLAVENGMPARMLASRYGVSFDTIRLIARGKRYAKATNE